MTPQLLIVGHIVKDVYADGWRAGGGALYAAAQASSLGIETAVVTACDGDIEPEVLVPAAQWHIVRLETSIQFENAYAKGHRTQRVRPIDRPLTFSDIPEDWRDATAILIAPVFHDVDPMLPRELVNEHTILGVSAQGWLRRAEGDRVMPGLIEAAPSWLCGNVAFVSEEDVVDTGAVQEWQERIETVVLTRGASGYTVWTGRKRHDLAPVAACEMDPTGAGDVFATAYLVRYSETGDVLESARFGAAAAAISVEGTGIECVPSRELVTRRLSAIGARG